MPPGAAVVIMSIRVRFHQETDGTFKLGNLGVNLKQWGFPGGSDGKESALQCRRPRFSSWVGKIPWRRDCLNPSILAWKIPWTEEPDGLQAMGSQRVGHD